MDPKALASLDPKLRETYEKVMGTSASLSSRPSTPGPATPLTPPLPARPTASIPTPVNSSLPNIPPPINPPIIQNNSTFTAAESPVQTPGLVTLQPTPTGAPLPVAQILGGQIAKSIQPLPSPASVNKSIATPSHSSPLIRILYIIASIIFFCVYTVFWLKILKYPVPFLPF